MPGTDDHLAAFGAQLRALRLRRHLTQQQLADAVGTHRSAIIRWEQGDFLPGSKALVLELAKHLHLDEQETRSFLEASLTALAPYWLVPLPQNPFFTGRADLLETLHARLGGEQAIALTQSAALHGLGGVGKTQLALEYAYQYALQYSAVFWLGAETEEQIVAGFVRIAEILNLPGRDDTDPQRIVAAVQRWLTTHRHWLVIWDNVEDLDLLARYLPVSRSGAILITTRRQALGTIARGIDLAPMDPEEGVLFLLRRAKAVAQDATGDHVRRFAVNQPDEYDVAKQLVAALGALPLALDQAGAYIEATRCRLSVYLELFHTHRVVLLQQRGEAVRDHPASVSTTFALAIQATTQRHPAVNDLLRVCALLQPDAIPEALVREGSPHLGATLKAACRSPLDWNRVVTAACAYSLLARHPVEQTLSMHRLVQAVLFDGLTEAERDQWHRRVVAALDAVFPDVLPATALSTRKWAEQLIPHALLCLSQEKADDDTLTLASVAYKAAQYLRECARYGEAEPLYRRALTLRERLLGSDHAQVAQTLIHLAILYTKQDQYAQAEPLFQRAVAIEEQTLGPDPPDVARSLHGLATLYYLQGRYPEAEPLYQRVLHLQEQAMGPTHLQVATSLNNLALLYMDQGRYAEAEPRYRRALHIREQALGANHPQVASSLNNLALLAHAQGQYMEAERLYQRALHLREEAQGRDHPDVSHPLMNLSELYVKQGRYAEAGPLLRRVLALWEVRVGTDHPDVATAFDTLATIHREQGQYDAAERWYLQARAIFERQIGPDHPKLAGTLCDLAICKQRQGHVSEALSLAERALTIRMRSLGEAHPETAAVQALVTHLAGAQSHEQEGASVSREQKNSPGAESG